MKHNKLLETVRLLDKLERKRFRNVIKNRRKSSLLSLYELCLSRIDKNLPMPPKEEVYPLLFDEKYSKANDFLLRNEFRLLTDEAEDFLRQACIIKYFPAIADAARLRHMAETGHTALFMKEFDTLNLKYKDEPLFWLAIDPTYLLQFILSAQNSLAHFANAKAKVEECQERLDTLYNRYSSDYGVKRAFCEKVGSTLSETPAPKSVLYTVKTKREDDLVNYRKLKAQSYHTAGTEKIKILQAAEKILRKNSLAKLGMDEAWWLKSNIALEYFLQHDFRNAILHYDALFASTGIEKFNRLPESALNYLSSLLGAGEYKKAANAVFVFENRIMASPPIFYKYICLKSFALLFLEQPQAARKELNRSKEHAVDLDFVYWKIILILSFSIENRWDEAEHEFKNLLNTKTVKQNTKIPLKDLLEALNLLIKFALANEEGKKRAGSIRLRCAQKLDVLLNRTDALLHPPKLMLKILNDTRK